MAQVVREQDSWDRGFSVRNLLGLAAVGHQLFEKELGPPGFVSEVFLDDGMSLSAGSVDELGRDLSGVRDTAVTRMELVLEVPGVAVFFQSDGLMATASPHTELRTRGTGVTHVYGIHAQLRRGIQKAFEEEDEAVKWQPKNVVPLTPSGGLHIGQITGDIGSIIGGNIAVSESGSATAGSLQMNTGSETDAWWKNPWLVSIVGGLIVFALGYLALPLL
jgi:hypothetical protein